MVVIVGVATGLAILVALNPVDGDHEYVPPPLPLKAVEFPWQMLALFPAFATGIVPTVM